MSPLLNIGLSPRLSSERFRYQQPKRFWAALFAGSLGLHLVAALLAPALWRSFSPPSKGTGTAPTPVELIDVSELGGAAPNNVTNPSDPALAGTPVTEAPATVPPASAFPSPQSAPQPLTPQPNPSFSDTTPVAPQPPADFSDTPAPTPLPQQPQPNQNPPAQPPQPNQGLPSGLPENGPVTGQPLPPVPNPADAAGEAGSPGADIGDTLGAEGSSDGLPGVGTPQQASPSRGVASLTPGGSLPADATADLPEIPPQPVQTSLDFVSDPTDPNSCLITPDSEVSFGEPVSLRLVIGADGRVIDAFEEGAATNPAYTELVRCVVMRNWQFTPATTGGVAQQSNFLVTLSIQSAP